MRIGSGRFVYDWIDNWARIPETASGRTNGRTHGVTVSENGEVIVFHQADPAVLVYDPAGRLRTAWGDRFAGAHGMAIVKEGDEEFLWLTDEFSAEVVKTTLDGRTVMRLPRPELAVYREGKYSPTWVAVNEERYGGNGDVWVADGYGMGYVHRFDKAGHYLGSINGEEGTAGAFQCPHGIHVNHRSGGGELYVADRGNKRVQVFDLEGTFKRVFGADFFGCPCGFVSSGEALLIPELCARLAVIDVDDRLVCYLGANESVCNLPGWPNHRPELIVPGKFNSPHAMAADRDGNLFIVEWIIGGRITKLVRS